MKTLLIAAILITSCASKNQNIYNPILAPEGRHVMVGNKDFNNYVSKNLSLTDLEKIEGQLSKSLDIPLTPEGFVQAANRQKNGVDETNYDAVWVRDSVWVYFSFIEKNEKNKARKLILSLWDYYASPDQQDRFKKIIQNPKLAYADGMAVPHIRFNGRDKTFQDVLKDGKLEEWNHRQNDAHGLFLLGLATAFKDSVISNKDLTQERKNSLNLFVPYFYAIKYWDFPDAGAWEEISKINTSSVAMVVKSLENWRDLKGIAKWSSSILSKLIDKGYERIRKNLSMSGESPDHDHVTPEYRREDAALFNLFLPMPLKGLTNEEKLLGLTIMEKLIRPYGVIRYPMDSYQSGNYWIKEEKKEGVPELTGDASSAEAFLARLQNFIPHSEAQWFFDSKLAMIYLQFAQREKKYLPLAHLHFKRALGQVTPKRGEVLAADGKPVQNLAFPESINTLVKDGKRTYAPSPITPLNWAKASFSMALIRLKDQMKKRP